MSDEFIAVATKEVTNDIDSIENILKLCANDIDIFQNATKFQKIDPEQKIDINYDRLKLQDLFLNLNPQIFSSAKFRKILLESNYKTKNFKRFSKVFGVKEEEIIESNKEEIIRKTFNFPWGPNSKTRSFVTNFELIESLIPSNIPNNLELDEFPPAHEPYDEMFKYQSDIYHRALYLIKKRDQRFIIQIPTGGGKTKLAMELVCNQLNSKKEIKILWIADRKELCEQATEAFEQIWGHKGKKKYH